MERTLNEKTSVSPQIAPEDVAGLAESGVTTIIANRPDIEIPEELASAAMSEACRAAGVAFVANPLSPGMLSVEIIEAQLAAIAADKGRTLAYCASGTRSSILWAFAMAMSGEMTNKAILKALDHAGYPAPGLAGQLDQVRR